MVQPLTGQTRVRNEKLWQDLSSPAVEIASDSTIEDEVSSNAIVGSRLVSPQRNESRVTMPPRRTTALCVVTIHKGWNGLWCLTLSTRVLYGRLAFNDKKKEKNL